MRVPGPKAQSSSQGPWPSAKADMAERRAERTKEDIEEAAGKQIRVDDFEIFKRECMGMTGRWSCQAPAPPAAPVMLYTMGVGRGRCRMRVQWLRPQPSDVP